MAESLADWRDSTALHELERGVRGRVVNLDLDTLARIRDIDVCGVLLRVGGDPAPGDLDPDSAPALRRRALCDLECVLHRIGRDDQVTSSFAADRDAGR